MRIQLHYLWAVFCSNNRYIEIISVHLSSPNSWYAVRCIICRFLPPKAPSENYSLELIFQSLII
jgi:hypothetical protein